MTIPRFWRLLHRWMTFIKWRASSRQSRRGASRLCGSQPGPKRVSTRTTLPDRKWQSKDQGKSQRGTTWLKANNHHNWNSNQIQIWVNRYSSHNRTIMRSEARENHRQARIGMISTLIIRGNNHQLVWIGWPIISEGWLPSSIIKSRKWVGRLRSANSMNKM